MRVSGLFITHQIPPESLPWLEAARSVVDELVAFVDDERAAPETREHLKRFEATIFSTKGPAFYQFNFKEMFERCTGDWILKFDFDEELAPQWQDRRWRTLLAQDEFNQFWTPRRWIVRDGIYIASEPWWPDWQLRLFRNKPEQVEFPKLLHETMRMAGNAGYLRSLAIHHHDLCLNSRTAREAKAAAYETERPGNSLGYFYLYEDYHPPLVPVPLGEPIDLDREILRMPLLRDADVAALAITSQPLPSSVRRSQLFWVEVTLHNGGSAPICCGAPHPVNLAYHWLDRATGTMLVYNGERTAIVPELMCGETRSYRMFVVTPETIGDYRLRITVVQEYRCWLYELNPRLAVDCAVRVI